MAQVIGIDGDDTLWENERYFKDVERRFHELCARWSDPATTDQTLIDLERHRVHMYGYGVKGFVLSMIECAIGLSDGEIAATDLERIVGWGVELLTMPVVLYPDVERTVADLAERHRLILVTKGDKVDQERKVSSCGLGQHFWAVEIVTEKDPATYQEILDRHLVDAASFTMIGNSVKSDVLPVIEIGGSAIQVPAGATWALEEPDPAQLEGVAFPVATSLAEAAESL